MAVTYIPQPVYPTSYDNDFTLFSVSNFGETVLSADLQAWATTIYIEPVLRDEIWSSNGFCTISGELIYYSSVEVDITSGKVIQLKNCIRNINNNGSFLNKKNTPVRQFVVAEHHNNLARAIVNLENFLASSNNQDTLTWKLNKLASTTNLGDDSGCPQISFWYEIASVDAVTGTTISYTLNITGEYNNFTIDFGDGSTETTATVGTHSYPPKIKINPIVTVVSNFCDAVQTTSEGQLQGYGTTTDEIGDQTTPTTTAIDVPVIPTFPVLDLTDDGIPQRDLQLPPIVFPAIDAKFGPITVPSTIEIVAPTKIPSNIVFDKIPSIASFINIVQIDPIPSFITIEPSQIQLLETQFCVNCTEESIVCDNSSVTTVTQDTVDGCHPCINIQEDSEIDGNEIENIQVSVQDFFVYDEDGNGSNRWDAVKLLLVSPNNKSVLLMGGGSSTYNEDTIPKVAMKEPVTIIFDDRANNNLYNWTKELKGGTFKPDANGNWQDRTDGIVNLASPAPAPPYGTNIGAFTDKKLKTGKWKVYVSVGQGPATQCTQCSWATKIVGMSDSFPTPAYLYDWYLVSDCGPNCGCPRPTAYPTAGATATTKCKNNLPPPDYEVPPTFVSISKVCVRIYYNSKNMAPCPTPTPTAGSPFALSDLPLPTPSYKTKREQLASSGMSPVQLFKELEIPFNLPSRFNVQEIEQIPENMKFESEEIKIKTIEDIQTEENKEKLKIIPKEHSVNVDVNNLFGET